MKIYVVTSGEYSDYQIDALYSTRDRALAHIGSEQNDRAKIEEWELDEEQDSVWMETWSVGLLEDGSTNPHIRFGSYWSFREQSWRGRVNSWDCHDGWRFNADSPISREHAHKLAVEARQEWLRKKTEPI